MRIILAHGALGPLDELVYVIPEVIFVVTMAFSWLRSRKADSLPGTSQPDQPKQKDEAHPRA